MSEIRITDPKTGGQKGQKDERYDLFPYEALDEVARVYAFGAKKYADDNWLKGYSWRLSLGALFRHVARFAAREDRDPESGLHHLAHAVFHCLALITFGQRGGGTDDRMAVSTALPPQPTDPRFPIPEPAPGPWFPPLDYIWDPNKVTCLDQAPAIGGLVEGVSVSYAAINQPMWLDLRIGGQRVTVHLVKPDDPRLDESYGACDFEAARIYIASNLEPGPREDTLFHELDHYVNEVSGAKLDLLKAIQAPRKRGDAAVDAAIDLEEDIVRARTPIWHRLLKDLGFQFPKGPTE